MNLGVLSLERRTVAFVLTFVVCVGGLYSYDSLGRLEDPAFTIKAAIVTTSYPGASAQEVEAEVTNYLAREIQRMGQIKRIEGRSRRGQSVIEVTIKDRYFEETLPSIWDELRRKLAEAERGLPPGAGPIEIDDDFGDVYGVYVALSGQGYSYRELKDYVDLLRRELLLVQDVKRIVLWGEQPEAVYVEMKRDRMAQLGITQEQIFDLLAARNQAIDGGRVRVGSRWVALDPTGRFVSEADFEDLLISEPGAEQLIYLGDVAEVVRGYKDPPEKLLRSSYKTARRDGHLADLDEVDPGDPSVEILPVLGRPAIGLAISTVPEGNVVTMGEAIQERLDELAPLKPVGVEMTVIALQSDSVTKAIQGFIISLLEAVVIVVTVMLLVTGLKSGLLTGFVMYVSIAMSFCLLLPLGVTLERISLGALVIALGMLVDDAVVISDGMKLRLERGEKPIDAVRAVVGQQQLPLFAGAIISIMAFGPIGLSVNSTGEFCRSLFIVLATTQLSSWFTGVTLTPLLCTMIYKPKQGASDQASENPYQTPFFLRYRRMLESAMRHRRKALGTVAGLLLLATYGFGLLPDAFFPASSRPQYFIDVWMPEGTHIRETEGQIARLEDFVMERENTRALASHVGEGAARFLLFYTPHKSNSAYGQLMVNVFDDGGITEDIAAVEAWAAQAIPGAIVIGKQFNLGPGKFGAIQLRLSGPDATVLRGLAAEAASILRSDANTKYVRNDWHEPVPVIRPVLASAQARRTGISRPAVAQRLESAYEGRQLGTFREGTLTSEDRLLPVISRSPLEERGDVDSLSDLQIHSPAADRMIPLRQVVSGFETVFENQMLWSRNRRPTMTLHADPVSGEVSVLWERLDARIQEWFDQKRASGEISSEYFFEWGGEHEDTAEANEELAKSIPGFVLLMVLIVVGLFNNLRQPLIIWLTVPLALIGVVTGLLLFNQPFNFMAVLGTLSLAGLLIRNAIVLIEQVNHNLGAGMDPYEAVVESAVSRTRPVLLSSGTTVLGLAPLLQDIFFRAMSIAMMFGLAFATVLTLLIVPVLYVSIYRIASPASTRPG